MARKPLAGVDRVTAIVVVTIVVLSCLTVLSLIFPSVHFIYKSIELATAIESVSIIIALGAFFLCFARFRVTSELRLLLLAMAFLFLALYNLVNEILVPTVGDLWAVTPDLLTYFWLSSRLLSALLLIASYKAGTRRVSGKIAASGVAAVFAMILLLIVFFFILGISRLPQLMSPGGWQRVSEGRSVEVLEEITFIGIIYQAVIGACFLVAGFGYLRLYGREHRPFWGWLSVSFIAAFFSQVNFLIYPTIYTSFMSMGDVTRLFSQIVLFGGTYAEIMYSYRNLQRRNQELQALQEISILGMSTRNVGEILGGITSTLREVFDADRVVMFLLEEDEAGDSEVGELVVHGPVSGLTTEEVAELRIPLSRESLEANVFNYCETIASSDAASEDRIPRRFRELLEMETVSIAPLCAAAETIGIIEVINKRQGVFTEDDIRFLTIIASRAAIVIENARLHDQIEASAVIEERMRLAREIHDGLAQNLGYLNLKLPQVLDQIDTDTGKAREELGEMRNLVQESMTEARQAIIDLQTPVSNRDFLDTVKEYAREFTRLTEIEVEIVAAQNGARLKPFAKGEMVRIIQEALNNVRRHAGASHVKMLFAIHDGNLRVQIRDNGRGFRKEDVFDGTRRRNFGVRSMTGRAKNLGGTVEIESKPGDGTTVTVEIPLEEGDAWTG